MGFDGGHLSETVDLGNVKTLQKGPGAVAKRQKS